MLRKKVKYFNVYALGTMRGDYLMCPWCANPIIFNYEDKYKELKDKAFDWHHMTCEDCNKKFKYFKYKGLMYIRKTSRRIT